MNKIKIATLTVISIILTAAGSIISSIVGDKKLEQAVNEAVDKKLKEVK